MDKGDAGLVDARLKWRFTYFLLALFLAWVVAALVITFFWLMPNPTKAGIVEAAGVGGVTGAFIVWVGLVIQYWFRKRPGE